MKWYMHACPECGGDLHDSDERGRVECLLCSRSFLASELLQPAPAELTLAGVVGRESERLHEPDTNRPERRAA